MSDSSVDLRFIANQLKSLNDRFGTMEDNVTVLTAMVIRMDGTLGGLVNELRAIHSQHSRLQNRVRELENSARQEGAGS